jgi:hypothetical protein
MLRRFSAFAVAVTVVSSSLVLAVPKTASAATVVVRLYDRDHHDYHRWDRREQREYRAYLAERHRAYVRYSRLHRDERQRYWNWRHERLEHERH